MTRPTKDNYYLDIALAVAKRSTCLRRCYGAVIVKDDSIIATGYNGSPRGETNCTDTGFCPRKEGNVPHNSAYTNCPAVHAEQNAIISASRQQMIGATLYLAGYDYETGEEIQNPEPCYLCRRMIINAGIEKVVSR